MDPRTTRVLVAVGAAVVVLALVLSIVALMKKPKQPASINRTLIARFTGDSLQPGTTVTTTSVSNKSDKPMTYIFSAYFFIPIGSSWGSEISYCSFDKGDGTSTLMFGKGLPANQSSVVTLAPNETRMIKFMLPEGFSLGPNGLVHVFWTPLSTA